MVQAYRRLPEGVRNGLRPLGGLGEVAAFLPGGPRNACYEAIAGMRSASAAVRHRAPLVLFTGRGRVDGEPLRLLAELDPASARYWTGVAFAEPPRRTVVGEITGPVGFARRSLDASDADLVLLRHHRAARRLAARRGFLSVPSWVVTRLDLAGSLDTLVQGSPHGRAGRKNDRRRATREGWTPEVVRGAAQVRRFLREWYLPFGRDRWGASFVPLSPEWMRQAERFCEVLWVRRADGCVAGALLEREGTTLRTLVLGLDRAGSAKNSAFAAVNYFVLEHAIASGCTRIRQGGSRPVLNDPSLRYKLKWGGRLTRNRQWNYLALRLGAGAGAATAERLLGAHPLIAEVDRDFHAVSCADDRAVWRTYPLAEWGIAGVVALRPGGVTRVG